jgi:hypothetical protein
MKNGLSYHNLITSSPWLCTGGGRLSSQTGGGRSRRNDTGGGRPGGRS